MDKKYLVCYVTDYRGGELNYETGLNEEELIKFYYEPYVDYIINDDYTDDEFKAMTVESICKLIIELDENESVYSEYAGLCGTSFPTVFEVLDDGTIEEGGPDDMLELGAKYIYDAIQKMYGEK